MLKSLHLIKSKYNLSDEFMANAIRSEIERQAMLDIRGIINNASINLLDYMIGEFAPVVIDTPPVTDSTPTIPFMDDRTPQLNNNDPRHTPWYTEEEIKKKTGIDTFVQTPKNKAKRRG